MTTGNFTDWAGAIVDIGPIYPFVGLEALFWILGMAFWVYWQVCQSVQERRGWEEDLSKFGDKPLPTAES